MNTDLESDCEAVIGVSRTSKQQPRQNSTISTTNLSKSNTEIGESSVTKVNNAQKKNDNGNLSEINFLYFKKILSQFRHYTSKNTIISFN